MRLDAYFTIEAAVYVPLLIFAMAKGMIMGVDLCKEVSRVAVVDEAIIDFQESDFIWKTSLLKKGVDFVSGNPVSKEPQE